MDSLIPEPVREFLNKQISQYKLKKTLEHPILDLYVGFTIWANLSRYKSIQQALLRWTEKLCSGENPCFIKGKFVFLHAKDE